MKATISSALWTFGICLFCGIIIVAIGFGAALPVLNRVAAPISCPGRDLQLSTESYYPRPGETDTTITWYCVDKGTGVKLDVTWQTVLAAGLIDSLILFGAAMIYGVVTRLQGQVSGTSPKVETAPRAPHPRISSESEGAMNKLAELKRMRDANLISDQEYEQKKAEILREM